MADNDPQPDASILDTLKTAVDIPVDVDYAAFDNKLKMFANAAFMTLDDLGVGPAGGFFLHDSSTTWADYAPVDETSFENAEEYLKYFGALQTYVGLKVRMLFDPPDTQYLVAAFDKVTEELGWRLNVRRENRKIDETITTL